MRIMIVEDDADVAGFLEETLNQAGHEATSFGHGGLAIGAIVRGKFETLLCDLMLPNMSGVQIIEIIRAQFPYLPIVAISALEAVEWESKVLQAGANCFIQKPIRMDRLLREVDLIRSSQVDLAIGVVDTDGDHRLRVEQELTQLGCRTEAWPSLIKMLLDEPTHLSVLLVEAESDDVQGAIEWAANNDVAAVAFGKDGFDEDKLMRMGASFCLGKPVDTESLVTQARFFVSPTPM